MAEFSVRRAGREASRRASFLRALAREAKRAGTLRVGVDGGTPAWPVLGFSAPDLAIGDWDSIRPKGRTPKARQVLTVPRDKDESDLAVALRAVLRMGVREVICAGFDGGRPDHALGVLYDLARASRRADSVRLLGPDWQAHFISQSGWKAALPRGTTVSIFAIGGAARGVTLRGFRFPLTDVLLRADTRGLSNVTTASRVRVSVKRGAVVAFVVSKKSVHA